MTQKSQINNYRLLLLFLFLLFFPFSAEAKRAEEASDVGRFTVQAVLPESQINPKIDYFHLLVKPSERQTVKIKLFNQSDKKQRYKVRVNQATTNNNGLLVYDEPHKQRDKSNKLPISEVVKPEQDEVEVAANSEKEVAIQVTPPTKSFEGILLGGIVVRPKSIVKENEKNISIQNRLSYTIALILTEKTETAIYGGQEVNLLNVEPKVVNGNLVIEAIFQNPSPEIIQQMMIEGSLTKKEQTKPIAKQTIKDIKFAPTSQFAYRLDLEEKELVAGKYQFQSVIKTMNGSKTTKKNVQISEKQVTEMKRALQKETNWRPSIIGGTLGLIIIVSGFIIYKRKRSRGS